MCCDSRGLSRLGVLLGLVALCVLLVAFVGGSWLYTKEPIILPSSDPTTITFRIGLWRACPSIKRINLSTYTPAPSCSLIKYNDWSEVKANDLGITWMQLDLAPVFITRMRTCTVLCAVSVTLLLLGLLLSLIGHCSENNKTLIGSGMYILAALFLGTSLVTFASVLSETLLETSQQYHSSAESAAPGTSSYDYRYGWCFFTASAAFIFIKVAVVFSLSGYLHRFPTDDEMVRVMVPGAERKLREHQSLSECIASCGYNRPNRQYDPLISSAGSRRGQEETSKHQDSETGPLLKKTPPDVCSTSNSTMQRSKKDDGLLHYRGACVDHRCGSGDHRCGSGDHRCGRDDHRCGSVGDDDGDKFDPLLQNSSAFCDDGSDANEMLAGQTVPITIKKYANAMHQPSNNRYLIGANVKFGTLPSSYHHANNILRNPCDDGHGIVGAGLEGASFKTLQYNNHHKQRKKVVISDTIQTQGHGGGSITDLTGRRMSNLSLSGSAV